MAGNLDSDLVNPAVRRSRREASEDPEGFWARAAEALPWFRRWDRVFEWRGPAAPRGPRAGGGGGPALVSPLGPRLRVAAADLPLVPRRRDEPGLQLPRPPRGAGQL